ncbi:MULTISPECIES: retron system putative HNH endonuclease [unclassified Nodularia (in: cyanobacteria)]|uniref:retron system putative HNH endonuclease n=1 Tax=unclassified Nodularia (in: cyanobacteria) TaxID=2656917 RepID=UPI00187FF363|nr:MULTISPECIES: retron system putative HNH endonuclease [unclassified Nodularia (in: cyanobacteria)]MBE9198812.1 TIGR02646 family protein [Nodularia sp. LEGE 06071]MCC2692966.1 TIGR02646 family protein [Nodularia sp. LEGE 04288]
MKYIKKNQEPEQFSSWKALENDDWKPSWDDNFQAPEKPVVHDALLKEQGYICCYCGMAVTRATSHIEHLQPRSTYPDLSLEYTNLIASCQGESTEPPPVPVHCGHQKKYWYDEHLMVSPLKINCADFFHYPASGEILPTNDPEKTAAAKTTIEKLALNINKLQNMRKLAIDAALLGIEDLTDAEIQQLVKGYDQIDSHGQYTPFCAAIIYFLKNYF